MSSTVKEPSPMRDASVLSDRRRVVSKLRHMAQALGMNCVIGHRAFTQPLQAVDFECSFESDALGNTCAVVVCRTPEGGRQI